MKNCEAQAGTLSNDRGTKTCSTVGAPYTVGEHQSYPGIGGPDWPKVYYSGHWHDEYTDQDITTQSQKGNGDVTTTTTTQLLSTRVVPDDCFYTFYGLTVDKPTAECAYFGVYPLS